MRAAIELRNVTFGAAGGIAPLLHRVLGAAMAWAGDVEFVAFLTLFNSDILSRCPNLTVRVLAPSTYWQDLAMALRSEPFDVLIRGYPGPQITGFPASRQVVFIPDNQHESFPGFFSRSDLATRRRFFGDALSSAGAIGTLTHFSRDMLLADPSTKCSDIFLMPPGTDAQGADRVEASGDVQQIVARRSPFFLYPANPWKHKNHRRLLEAMRLLRASGGEHAHLVLTGHRSGWEEIMPRATEEGISHLGYVAKADLHYIMRHARGLVFPSLYEGFGMPVLEAFAAGCPVACSDAGSLPEVANGAALLFDPLDPKAIAAAMRQLLDDDALRRSLIARGTAQLGRYSWDVSGRELVAACRRVALPAAVSEALVDPVVTIVTPSYQQGRFLRRTVESVLAQDYGRLEYRVVDGGSTDESVDVLRSFGERVAWTSEPDAGQTNAINKGFLAGTGTILGFLNSDDVLLPGAIRRVVDYFAVHPECDMLYGDANYIDGDDRVVGRYRTAPYSFERLMFDCCVCQPATFWRASIAAKVGPFDETLHLAMDYDYWLRIARAGGEIHYLPEVLASSRVHPATKTNTHRSDVYREIFAVCRRHGGYVDASHYLGYWDHRLRTAWGAPGRAVASLRTVVSIGARVHHAWDHHDGSLGSFVLRVLPSKFASAWRTLRRKHRLPGVAGAGRLSGFHADGWFGPHVTIHRRHDAPATGLYFAGRPAARCTLDVVCDGVATLHRQLDPAQDVRIEMPQSGCREVSLRFSAHRVDEHGRALAFLVLGTNLFEEADAS